jgi:hypothetical protein
MKIKQIFVALIILSMLFFATNSRATDIKAAGSGNWSSTVPNAPWPGGILPTTNDDVDVVSGITITVDTTNAVCQFIYSDDEVAGYYQSSGTVTMAPNSTLTITGPFEGYGAQTLGVLNATATNCTVIYQGNAFWAKRADYYNLVFSGWGDFYNGAQNNYPSTPMNIFGNFIVNGTNVPSDQPGYTGVYVECGDNFTVYGDLYIGASNAWDCSVGDITVMGNTTCAGVLWDKDAVNGSNYFAGGLTILPSNMVLTNVNNTLVSKLGWTGINNVGPNDVYGPGNAGVYGGSLYVMDVQQWAVGGNFTNDGIVGFGTNYGSVDFTGTGVIAGSNTIFMPTMTIDGTYEINDTINLTTNYPTINGTVVFDLANSNQIVLNAGTNWFWYSTGGTLDVTNSGAPPISGNTYQLFNNIGNPNYGGAFSYIYLPDLSSGLSWVTNLATSGSISVTGNVVGGTPDITAFQYNSSEKQLTLTWASTPGATYSVLLSTNLATDNFTDVLATGIPSGGNSTTNTVTLPVGNAGFIRISQP